MRQYRVKVIAITGMGKNIHRLNDVMNENQMPDGRCEELVKLGYLERTGEAAEEKRDDNPPPPPTPPAGPEEVTDPEKDDTGKTEEEKAEYDNITRNELMAQLELASVEFSKNSSKAELFKLYKEKKAEQLKSEEGEKKADETV